MPRGNRYYIPGLIWHITHRCHKKEFLLKFARDRKCWLRWLYEAKKRYALTILNFTVTSNHIHLLGIDDSDELRKAYNSWRAAVLRKGGHARDAKWTQSIAVGSKVFIEDVKDQLGYKAIGRKIVSTGDVYYLNLV